VDCPTKHISAALVKFKVLLKASRYRNCLIVGKEAIICSFLIEVAMENKLSH
jgi:hypothetical protein